METYPHVFITSPDEWDPSQVPDQPFGDPMFDAYGDFNEPIIANLNIILDAPDTFLFKTPIAPCYCQMMG